MAKVLKNNIKTTGVTKILVTGGAGFIGSNLVDALISDGFDVTVLDNLSTGKRVQVNKKAKFINADIRNLKSIKKYFKGVEYVFHTAARARIQPSIVDPIPTMEHNINGTLNVLLAARDAGVRRLVYSASSSSYGDQKKFPLKEDMRPDFRSPYALSKYVGEELCRLFSGLFGLETVSLRYFNVYGPRQLTGGAYATAIGIFLDKLKNNQPITIFGNGTKTRDFTNVLDVVRANIFAMKSKKVGRGEVINIGTGKNYSMNQVASAILFKKNNAATDLNKSDYQIKFASVNSGGACQAILASSQKTGKLIYAPDRPGENKITLADNSKAKKLLGWRSTISLDRGLDELIK